MKFLNPAPITTLLLLAAPMLAFAEGPSATLSEMRGDVRVKAGKGDYAPAKKGQALPDGVRLRTGDKAEATLTFADGSESKVAEKSEIIVQAPAASKNEPSGVTLFIGRVWSSVTKHGAGKDSFEVHSANAVAGVRGTKFEVGVALDGSTKVVVREGEVGVEGEEEGKRVGVKGGQTVESDNDGKLESVDKAPNQVDWDGWFGAKAKAMEKAGLKIAKDLDGRLNRRRAKVEQLVREQKSHRQAIEKLEARKKRGESVDDELHAEFAKLEKVTARLEGMKARCEGAFGLFEKWNTVARGSKMPDGDKIAGMASDIAKIAADFADMIEEGKDLSEEGMDDMMKDMQKGKRDTPKDNAGDELFK